VAEVMEIYVCEKCGNVVEVLRGGAGTLVCCGQDMVLVEPRTSDEGREKHVPVIEKSGCGYKVTVGSVAHPMTEEHHIEWIELIADGAVHRAHLDPTGEPTATFCVEADSVTVRESCNVHGIWGATA